MAPYTDWADWAGDHPEEAEAELRRNQPMPTCEHAEVYNQGVCVDCGDHMASWEPDEQQLDQHHGTSVAA